VLLLVHRHDDGADAARGHELIEIGNHSKKMAGEAPATTLLTNRV
jgi:hypothetical protein